MVLDFLIEFWLLVCPCLVDCFRLFDVVHDVVDSIQVCDLLNGFEACRVSADSV